MSTSEENCFGETKQEGCIQDRDREAPCAAASRSDQNVTDELLVLLRETTAPPPQQAQREPTRKNAPTGATNRNDNSDHDGSASQNKVNRQYQSWQRRQWQRREFIPFRYSEKNNTMQPE
mmetsp:Transcript_30311/g.54891  ORF Transcript_30311/g.54891 Transcript_30311/m.54891 type:complete len:120 (-) Transcript_30311:183-542(-)